MEEILPTEQVVHNCIAMFSKAGSCYMILIIRNGTQVNLKSQAVKLSHLYCDIMIQFHWSGSTGLTITALLEYYYFFFLYKIPLCCQRKLMTGFAFTSYGSTTHLHEKALEGICNFSVFFKLHVVKPWWYRWEGDIHFPTGNTLFYLSLINRFEINFSFSMDFLILQLI